jgi:EmrB/QacA subfamily drug resistance transporter
VSSRSPAAGVAGETAFRISFLGLMLAVVVSSLDQNIVSVALPRIAAELGGIAYISWTVTAFLLTSTISTPVYGKLSDMYGRSRLFATSMVLFLVTSILCSAARTMPQLIAARALQGLGAGGLITLSQSAIGDLVGPSQRGRFQGYFSGALATSTVLGPLLGGALILKLSWRWIFLVTVPIGAASLALIQAGLPPAGVVKAHRIDYLGSLLLAAGTCATLLCVSSVESSLFATPLFAVGMGVIAVTCTHLFVLQERRAAEPLLDLALFSNAGFVIGAAAAGMMTFAMQGAIVFLPLYFQAVEGLSPTRSGLMLIAQVAGMILSSIVGGRLSSRTGQFKKFFITGVTLEALALAALATFALISAREIAFLAALAVLGLGMGLGMPNAVVVVQNSVPRPMLGIATASMSFLRSMGAAVGVALSGCLMHYTFKTILKHESVEVDAITALERGSDLLRGSISGGAAHVVRALRLAIASSFALGASVMLLALVTTLALPSDRR